mmetsp:Transcript_2111/g.2796  ORF Transcript_2111/g.2796 Transcript_2111/m.2796 type:complete len:118 (-) Transcript_2111:656-1009(-)
MSTNQTEQTPQIDAQHLSSSLMAASKFIGHLCDAENTLFVDCKRRNQHPAACIPTGKAVLSCTERAIQLQENHCAASFLKFTQCLDKHANMLKRCKAEQAELDNCVATEIIPKLSKK